MTCRTRAAGSLATTYAQHQHGLLPSQCTSLYHALRREAIHSGASPSQGEYDAAVGAIERSIGTGPWSATLRSRALHRVDRARRAGLPSHPGEAWALTQIDTRAAAAARELDARFAVLAARHGIPAPDVRLEFRRLSTAPDRDQAALLPSNPPPLPDDAGTRWALHVLDTGSRCPACGQFAPASGAHACPAGRQHGSPAASQPATAPAVIHRPVPWADDMDAFQQAYEEAKARMAAGEQRVPSLVGLAAIPGAITGGLGLENTFGLELEVDFPDDIWPFEQRHLLASTLAAEGICLLPRVQQWHHVGDDGDDRPGGEFRRSPHGWICEHDRSVDDCDGARGTEIKSQILLDSPEAWHALARVCEVATALGARPTPRCGLHVNVGAAGFPEDDPAPHTRLLQLAAAYDDTLIRLAHNPDSGPAHRGRRYCAPVSVPPGGFRTVDSARWASNHYQAFNLEHLPSMSNPASGSSRIEARIFDASLDPGRIGTQVALTLALASAARNGVEPGQEPEFAGAHRQRHGTGRLTGADWEASTLSFRRLVDIVAGQGLDRPEHRQALTWLFAASRWQR